MVPAAARHGHLLAFGGCYRAATVSAARNVPAAVFPAYQCPGHGCRLEGASSVTAPCRGSPRLV